MSVDVIMIMNTIMNAVHNNGSKGDNYLRTIRLANADQYDQFYTYDDDDDDEVFKNQIIRTDYVFTKEELESILSNVDEDIIRIKGYVNSNEGTLYLNYVLNEYHIYSGEKREDSLVSIIGTKIDRNKYKEVFHG